MNRALAAAVFALPFPTQPVPGPPPLEPGAAPQTQTEFELRGHVASRSVVDVGLGPAGDPVRVIVTQRLRVDGTGDYSFVIPAPVTKVVPAEGSESLPGLRDVGIVWQGFSDRHRLLSATATLEPAAAAAGLPLRVRVERRPGSTVVRLSNLAHRRLAVAKGHASRASLMGVLRSVRAWLQRPLIGPRSWYARGRSPGFAEVEVAAPLHVTGELTQGDDRVAVDELLGGGERPLEKTLVVPGAGAPALELRVELLPALEILPTPRELARSARPLADLQTAINEAATAWAYRHYLATPDPVGRSETSYRYRSVAAAAPVPVPGRRDDDDTLAIVLGALLGAALLAGLAVLWARS